MQVKADDEEPAGSSVSTGDKKDGSQPSEKAKKHPSVCLLLCLKLQEKRKAMRTQQLLLPCRESQRKRLPPLFHLPFVHCFCFLLCFCGPGSCCSFCEEGCRTTKGSCQTKCSALKAAPASAPKPNTPSAVKGKLAVVIDDAGRDLASQHVYESLGIPLTLAVMPNQVHTRMLPCLGMPMAFL